MLSRAKKDILRIDRKLSLFVEANLSSRDRLV